MPADPTVDRLKPLKHKAVELSCSWCGSAVPLPPGEFSGVCIDCGTVMFRDPILADSASERSLWNTGSPLPAPAV